MAAIFTANSGSRLPFQVLVACQLIPASRRIWRTVSVLATIRCAPARCSTSLVRLQVVNGSPSCWGAVLATRQTISRATDPNLRGRPPLHFGSKAANPWALNAWITSRAYCAVAANIAAASAALRPCTEASTIPARRSRTRSRAVLVILTRRCASAGSNSRTNTSGLGELRPAVGIVHQRLRVTVTAGCTDLSAQDASAIGYRTRRARVNLRVGVDDRLGNGEQCL